MDFTAILGILIIFIIISVLYFIYTSNTYIVRINKNQVMEFRSAMELTGLPIITFYQGKEMYNFLLDTGSNISYVNSKSSIQVEKTGSKDVFMGSDGTDRDCEIYSTELMDKIMQIGNRLDCHGSYRLFGQQKEDVRMVVFKMNDAVIID